jgi:DNA-nicking Smr family endonuclease
MSSEPDEKRRPRRRLTDEEHRLWSGITRSVAPLKRRRPLLLRAHDSVRAHAMERPVPPAHPRPETPLRHPGPKPPPKALPGIGSLERRQKQRLGRGTEPIDARIDLHGRTQSEAHAALLGFLRRAQAEGARFALVITGKGGAPGAPAGERGILKRQVPHWLRQPEFRVYVVAAEAAHPAHGGEGALYLRIRRAGR